MNTEVGERKIYLDIYLDLDISGQDIFKYLYQYLRFFPDMFFPHANRMAGACSSGAPRIVSLSLYKATVFCISLLPTMNSAEQYKNS